MFYNKNKSFEQKYSGGFFPFFASFQTFTATILLAHIFSFKSILLLVFQIQEYTCNMEKTLGKTFPFSCDLKDAMWLSLLIIFANLHIV